MAVNSSSVIDSMTKYLLILSLLWSFGALADDMIVYPHGMAKPGIYVPGFRTYSTSTYRTSGQNVEFLRQLSQSLPKLRIAGFSATSPGETTLVCRLSFPVYLPGKIAHEVYLAESMRAELLEAGLYSETAPVALNAHLVSMDFNSVGTGKWVIEARFSVAGKEPITIKHEHSYSIGMGAVQACGDVSRALVPALQGFLFAAYSDSNFQALLQSTANPAVNSDRPQAELVGSLQPSASGGQLP